MRTIRMSNGLKCLVDDEIYESLSHYKWYYLKSKNCEYATRTINKKPVYMHRSIMEMMLGRPLQKGEEIDHIDGNGLNNQRENLRLAGRSTNMANMKHHIESSSEYKGVHYQPRSKHHWQAKLMKDRKNIYLGYFDTEIEAAIQYDLGALYFFKDYAKLNFPDRRQEYLDKLDSGFNPVHIPRKTTSKYRGVSFDSYSGKWRARLKVNGKDISLGLFATEQEAYEATLVSI